MTRWLTENEIEQSVNPILADRGWAQLNFDVCRVRGAFDEEGNLLVFFVLQLFPLLGPLVRSDNTKPDNGDTTRALVAEMETYLTEERARGFMAIAESPFTKRLCERFGMAPLEHPVYMSAPAAMEVAQ